MERYNYLESVKQDVREYIEEHDIVVNEDNRDEVEQQLNDDCFICDSVTGNASGSYTFNTWQAEENLCHNLDLLGEALTEFCCEPNYITEKGAEACDVTIRCYLLGQAIGEVLDEMLEEDEDDD
jgi:DNA-directed RNA polymerase subunit N (RpoN/RPB10)